MDHALVRTMEHMLLRTFPPIEQDEVGGLFVGYAQGVTGRANSAVVLEPSTVSPAQAVDEVEAWYLARGLPPRFRLTPLTPESLRSLLVERGYRPGAGHVATTDAMYRDLTTIEREDLCGLELASTPSSSWVELTGRDPRQVEVIDRMLRSVDGAVIHAAVLESAEPCAVGRGVVADDWLSVQAMFTSPGHRRRGFGRRIVDGLHRWAVDQGARHSFLNVISDNRPAVGAYRRASYRTVYRYDYLVGPSPEDGAT